MVNDEGLKMETLIDLFRSFKKRGNEEVFIYRTGIRRLIFTYANLYEFSLRMSSYLKEQGIKSGDKVAIWAPNSPSFAFSYFGILLSGAIIVPIDFASGKNRAETIVKLSGAKFIIQSNYKFEKLSSTNSGFKSVMIEDLSFIIKSFNPIKKVIHVKPEDIAEIVYTSGTTGDPKGVVLTHENIISNIMAANSHVSIPQAGRRINFLSVLPTSHMLEQTVGFLIPLYRGDKIIYLRTIKPSSIMQAFKEENIAAMLVVPRFLSILKNTIERELENKHLLRLLRFQMTKKIISKSIHKKFGKDFQMFMTGGATLDSDVFAFWKNLGFKVVEGYGLTECSPIVCANTFEEQIPSSVGKPLKNVKVKLDNNELLVKGESVFSKYYQNPKATEESFKDGWFRTGDYADIDEKGNIFIKGRKKDVIVNSSGINIYPTDLESVLNKIRGVKDSCVLGRDLGEGETVYAVLLLKNKSSTESVLDKDFNASEIIRLANEKLDPLAQIQDFSVWEDFDFPRTTTLKIQKFKVKERLLKEASKTESKVPEDTLITLIANVCKKTKAEIKESSILTLDLGLNSLSRLELTNYLEQEFRVDLEDTVINQNTTVSDLRKLLSERGKIKKQRGLWLWTNGSFGRRIREFLDNVLHKPISHLFLVLQSRGFANLKEIKGPVVFIANHVSYLDQPAIMYSLPKNIRYKTASATREEFFFSEDGTPYIRKILFLYSMIGFNTFLLPQKSGFRKSLAFMGKLIDKNMNILIFPEGTRSKDGKLQDFMSGLGLLVKELEVPVVPIKILGMEKIYPRGSKFPKKGKCTVVFGKPLEFTTETPSEIVEKSRKAILDLERG